MKDGWVGSVAHTHRAKCSVCTLTGDVCLGVLELWESVDINHVKQNPVPTLSCGVL